MKRTALKRFLIPTALLVATFGIGLSTSLAAETQPNTVVILADDMGIDRVSAFNDKLGLETPNIGKCHLRHNWPEKGCGKTDFG